MRPIRHRRPTKSLLKVRSLTPDADHSSSPSSRTQAIHLLDEIRRVGGARRETTLDSAVDRTDCALYAAKSAGRNQVMAEIIRAADLSVGSDTPPLTRRAIVPGDLTEPQRASPPGAPGSWPESDPSICQCGVRLSLETAIKVPQFPWQCALLSGVG